MLEKWNTTRDEASVSVESTLTRDEYQEVAGAMRGALDGGVSVNPRRKAPRTPKPPEDPAKKELRQKVSDKKMKAGKLQRIYTALRNESCLARGYLPKIEARGFPASFVDHLSKGIELMEQEADEGAQTYGKEIIREAGSVAEVDASIAKLEEKFAQLEKSLTDARKGSHSKPPRMVRLRLESTEQVSGRGWAPLGRDRTPSLLQSKKIKGSPCPGMRGRSPPPLPRLVRPIPTGLAPS